MPQKTSQACDNGTNNQWYDEMVLEGNYWSDYNGTVGVRDFFPSRSPYRYACETDTFPQDVLIRIGVFLIVSGLLGGVLLVSRRKKGS